MRTYLISYDLANPAAKSRAIAEEIMSIGDRWARPLEQTWYVTTSAKGQDIEARISWLLGDEDGLLIQAADDDAVLANTTLRWFRHRPAQTGTNPSRTANDNTIPFKTATAA